MQAGFDVYTARGMTKLGIGMGVLLAASTASLALLRVPLFDRPAPGPAAEAAPIRALPLPAASLEFPVLASQAVKLQDNFAEARAGGARIHRALDIMVPRFTPVRAVADGTVARLASGGAGGVVVYQYDASGAYAFYYAHLQSYAPGLREGQVLRRGQVIGYVGTSGNAPPGAPHLHFAVLQLRERNRWWAGEAVNPYPLLKQGTPDT
jgi:peptidoglycan LD-endopeptidase LytH